MLKNMFFFNYLTIFICQFLLVFCAQAHEAHTKHQANSLAISVAFDTQGKLWRAAVKDGFVLVDASEDLGKTFSRAVQVNEVPMKIGADGEARPKIALSKEGHIFLTWTQALKTPFAGYIWFARSVNGGKSFEKPFIVHQDRAEITHRFDALNLAADGKITVAWVDKRDLIAAKAVGKPYDGAAIYYAVSEDGGKNFLPEQKLADSSCECCRIAFASKQDGTLAVLWRHVFAGSERDHAMLELHNPKLSGLQKPNLVRASFGHWKIDGCPHHGAALAEGAGFGYHLAYFDGAGDTPSLMVSRMDSDAWVSSPPKKFGNSAQQAGHPALWSFGEKVVLVWREQANKISQIWQMRSDDGGKSWGAPSVAVESAGKADYPFLQTVQNRVYLIWNTQEVGLQVIELK